MQWMIHAKPWHLGHALFCGLSWFDACMPCSGYLAITISWSACKFLLSLPLLLCLAPSLLLRLHSILWASIRVFRNDLSNRCASVTKQMSDSIVRTTGVRFQSTYVCIREKMPLVLMMVWAGRHFAELARRLHNLHHWVHDKHQLSRATQSTGCALYTLWLIYTAILN